MIEKLLFTTAVLIASAAAWVNPPATAATIPAPPKYYVLDEPGVLSAKAKLAIETLLIEHTRITQQQVLLAVFSSLDGEDLNDWTNRVYSEWGIGKRGKDEGALLAVYWKEHRARIEVGYGLEPLLTDARSKRILSDFLVPEMRAGNVDRALSLAVYQLLATIESPLVANGRADQILRGEGGFRGSWQETSSQPFRHGWVVWLFLGAVLLTIAFNILSSAEAHFSGTGWYRPKPWQRGRWGGGAAGGALPWIFMPRGRRGGGWGGGGGFGGWGSSGGGGFQGGGGSSGGGGASAGW